MSCNRKQRYLQHKNYNMSIIEQFLAIVAPHECLGCGAEGQLLCSMCSQDLPSVPPRCYRCGRANAGFRTCLTCRPRSGIFRAMAVTPYDALAKQLVHRLKFERAQAAASEIADLMAARLAAAGYDLVTYVPTAPSRVRQRGYDQAQLIARQLAHRLGLPCYPLLVRVGSQRQVGSSRAARHQQMQQAFRAQRQQLYVGQHVLLVDDVLTTGATCEAAAGKLKQAGAKRVSIAVFAVA